MTMKYPSSYLFTMVSELLHEMDLPYEVKDVMNFGFDRDEGPEGAMFVEVLKRDGNSIYGKERIVRWIERDISYADWGNGGMPGVVE